MYRIARSNGANMLGTGVGVPAFKIKDVILFVLF